MRQIQPRVCAIYKKPPFDIRGFRSGITNLHSYVFIDIYWTLTAYCKYLWMMRTHVNNTHKSTPATTPPAIAAVWSTPDRHCTWFFCLQSQVIHLLSISYRCRNHCHWCNGPARNHTVAYWLVGISSRASGAIALTRRRALYAWPEHHTSKLATRRISHSKSLLSMAPRSN